MGGKIKKVPFRYSDTLFFLYFLILRQVCFLPLFDLRPPSFANFAFYNRSFSYSCFHSNLSNLQYFGLLCSNKPELWFLICFYNTQSFISSNKSSQNVAMMCAFVLNYSISSQCRWLGWNHLCLPGRTQLLLTPSRASRSRWADMSQTGLTLGWSWAGGSCH